MSGGVLVTGGAGFIGSHLVDGLVQAGERVTVLDDFSSGEHGNLSHHPASRVRVITGSILDDASIEEALADCDRVYHLAVQCVRRSLSQPRQNHDINATGTLNLLESARRMGIRRFVYCSSSEVYGNASEDLLDEDTTPCRPVTVYGAAKLAGELYSEAYRQTYGLPTVVVRPFNAYGPRAHETGDLAEVVVRFLIRILNGLPPIIFGDGSNGRDFTYVTDVANGLRLAGESDSLVGHRVNIAFGRMMTVRDVARTIMQVCGRNDLDVQLSRPRPGDVGVLRADTRRASEILGYRADISFEDGIRRYLDWFRKRHPDPATLLESNAENWTTPAAGSRALS
jgi:UDP-glucose 4-epimerase